jgi:hypothetical protein
MIKINNNQHFVAPPQQEQSVNDEIVSVNATEILHVNAINIHPLQPTHLLYLSANRQSEIVNDNNRFPDIEENVNYERTDYDVICCDCCPPSREAAMCYTKCCAFCILTTFLFLFIILVGFFSSNL